MTATTKATSFAKRFRYSAWLMGVGVIAWTPGEIATAATAKGDGLVVTAVWEPIARSAYGFQQRWPRLATLAPAERQHTWSDAELSGFAPPATATVGTSWRLDPERVLPIVRQLHATAQLEMHLACQTDGGFALLVARNEQLDVVQVRLHADFPLDDIGSWYTPAQLAGRIVFERVSNRPLALELGVPARDSNVDLNWAQPSGDGKPAMVEADIGYVPRLGLTGAANDHTDTLAQIVTREPWNAQIDEERAATLLARCFYDFAKVDWLPFEAAVEEATQSGKPLHVVALFGTLDDESC